MNPSKKEDLPTYEKNARIMYYIGFALLPFSWLMCYIYASRRQEESIYLKQLSQKALLFFWIGIFVIGAWTIIYHCFWDKMPSLAYFTPAGEIE